MDHTRHADIFDVSKTSATLIGCGGIGAATALVLAKMGIGALQVYDDDAVSQENLPTQFHRLSDVGKSKVAAVVGMLAQFADDTDTTGIHARIYWDSLLSDFMIISAVDSISARKEIWQAVKRQKVRWYLDARMAAEAFHLYTVDMKDPVWYENILADEDDNNVPELACTAKATIYCASVAAGLIGSAVKTIVNGQRQPRVLAFHIPSLSIFTA